MLHYLSVSAVLYSHLISSWLGMCVLDYKFTELLVAMRDFPLLQFIILVHHKMYYVNVVFLWFVCSQS